MTRTLAYKVGKDKQDFWPLEMVSSASRETLSTPCVPSTIAHHSSYTQRLRFPLSLYLFSSKVLWPDLSTLPRSEEERVLRPDFARGLGAGSWSRPCFHNSSLVLHLHHDFSMLLHSCTFRYRVFVAGLVKFFLVKRKDRPCDRTSLKDPVRGARRDSYFGSLLSLVFSVLPFC